MKLTVPESWMETLPQPSSIFKSYYTGGWAATGAAM